MKKMICRSALLAIGALALASCAPNVDALVKSSTGSYARPDPEARPGSAGVNRRPVPLYTYKVVQSWPHHRWSFTEGLVFQDGILLESSGLYEKSALMQTVPGSGQILGMHSVPGEYFAEGITVFRDRIYQLTLSGSGFIYHHKSLRQVGEFSFEGEGWGLTHDGTHLIMSNGSSQLNFIDPETFKTKRTISVNCNGVPLKNLNALQYVKGEIFANVWQTDYIVRIEPKSGEVIGWINLKGLLRPEERSRNTDVLNGIAYDELNDRLVVTGKRWPKYFEIRLEEVQTASS